MPPAIDFAPLENAVEMLTDSAAATYDRRAAARAHGNRRRRARSRLNAKLRQSEQQLIDAAGLPNREWYRHLLYAPGFYTGYGVKTLPGVREGIEQGRYEEAETEIVRAGRALMRLAALLDSASAELEGLTQ